MVALVEMNMSGFYSHVICSGTKIVEIKNYCGDVFYSHVICSGTKIATANVSVISGFTVT